MAEVEVIHLTRAELLARKAELDAHIANCCAAHDGYCSKLEWLGEIQFLLSKESDGG